MFGSYSPDLRARKPSTNEHMTLATSNTGQLLDQSQITSLQDFFEPYELLELERHFRSFDKDGSGELYLAEMCWWLVDAENGSFTSWIVGDFSRWCNKTDVSTAFMKWKFQNMYPLLSIHFFVCKYCYSHHHNPSLTQWTKGSLVLLNFTPTTTENWLGSKKKRYPKLGIREMLKIPEN